MARPSGLVTMDIALVEASNTENQNGVNSCSARLEQLQDRIDELGGKKAILESTYSIYTDLKTYIEGHLASLEDTSVCITEIKTEATEQIGGKIDVAIKALEDLIGRIETALTNANSDYNNIPSSSVQIEFLRGTTDYMKNNEVLRLGTLQTELEQAKAAELPVM